MKQTFILGGVALALVLAVGAFVFFFSGTGEDAGQASGDERRGGLFGSLFPFQSGGSQQVPSDGDGEGTLETPQPDGTVPQLRRVSDQPAAGGTYFANPDGSMSIRYIERASGHIFETLADRSTVKRVSNTTVPGIQEALWLSKNSLVLRYLNDDGEVETFLATLASTTAEQTLQGKFLPSWDRATLDSSRTNILSVEEGASGSTLYVTKADGTGKRVVYTSPLRSWSPLQSDRDIFLQTAAASGVPGFLYRLSGQTLVKVLGDVAGLVAVVNPSGRYVLFSAGAEDTLATYLIDTSNNELYESPVATIASKCAFLGKDSPEAVCGVPATIPDGSYPNDWLLGRVSFSDDVWVVDAVAGAAQLVALPEEEARASLDVTYPTVSPDGTYFGFIDKNNLSFWSLRLLPE